MRRRVYQPSDELNPFLEKICRILIERNLTPTNLSLKAGLGSSTLSNLLKRNNIPTFTTLEKICAVLDLSLSDFIKDIETTNPQIIEEARSGAQQYDPLINRKRQIIDEWSSLPLSDRNDTLKKMMEKNVRNSGKNK